LNVYFECNFNYDSGLATSTMPISNEQWRSVTGSNNIGRPKIVGKSPQKPPPMIGVTALLSYIASLAFSWLISYLNRWICVSNTSGELKQRRLCMIEFS